MHLGVALMFFGFAGRPTSAKRAVTLAPGQTATIGALHHALRRARARGGPAEGDGDRELTVLVDGKEVRRRAARRSGSSTTTRTSRRPPRSTIKRAPAEDLYLALNGYDLGKGAATLKLVVNPLVNWIWFGFILLSVGTVIASCPMRLQSATEQAQRVGAADKARGWPWWCRWQQRRRWHDGGGSGSGGGAATPGGVATAVVVLLLLAAGGAHAQGQPPRGQGDTWASTAEAPRPAQMEHAGGGDLHTARNDHERALFFQLKCLCNCMHALNECGSECGPGVKWRLEVQKMIDAGKSDQIFDWEMATYGQEALRVPVDRGFNRLAWLLPYLTLLGAAGTLVTVGIRRSRRRAQAARARAREDATRSEASEAKDDKDDEYQARLDDELDGLD